MNYLIRNASVVNEGEIFTADVYISEGLIRCISRQGETPCATVPVPSATAPGSMTIIDASRKYLIPGIIDEHVHFREPGLTHKADICSESRAAVSGGVTSFMDMPNTVPQTVTDALLEEKFRLASEKSLANYSFYIGATNDNLQELLGIDYSKVCGIKLFMGSSTGNMLVDSRPMLEALFSEAPCLIAAHCEDEQTIRANTDRLMTAAGIGPGSTAAGLGATVHPLIRDAAACFKATERAVELAEKSGARLHVLHISTADELRLFEGGKPLCEKRITAETCPHYLWFDDSAYGQPGCALHGFGIKCNPAIKSAEDRQALLEALRSGKIDTVGTDHAPHLPSEKYTGEYLSSKSGFPSVEHSLDIMYEVSRNGYLHLPELVRLMCHNPAILYRIDRRGFIRPGYHADLALVDFDCTRTISGKDERTKCGWTPYAGTEVHSRVTHTFVNGNLIYENGEFHDSVPGERLEFK